MCLGVTHAVPEVRTFSNKTKRSGALAKSGALARAAPWLEPRAAPWSGEMFGARLALVAVWVHLAVGVYGCTDDAEWDNGAGKRCDEYAAKYCAGGHLLVVL